MLSLIPRCKSPKSLRPPVQDPSKSRDGECLTVQKPLRHRRKVDTVMANIEILVDEVISKREAWGKSSGAKRRLPSDNAINLDSYVKLGEFIAQQLGEVETGMPNSANLISISGSSPRSSSPVFGVLTHAGWLSPDPSNPNSPLPPPSAFPPGFLSSPAVLQSRGLLTGLSPATAITYALTSKSRILDNVDNQELFQYYLDVPAQRLVDSSPSYIDVFRKYIPAMAQESPALMEGLLGLASIQQELAEGKDDKPSLKTIMHYQRALEMHYQSLKDPDALESDIPLATSLILSHYELWSGELIKLGVHMIGCRDIIELRGKAAHMTPVGRALFAAFRRLDVSTSMISGNPSFQTDDWWTVDPLTRTPILEGSPALLSADAAFSKLCVICSRLCHLKAWIIRRRREVHQSVLDCPEEIRKSKREALEAKIGLKISKLEDDLGGWLGELPQCFKPLEEEEGDVEDINTTEICSITPKLYKHKAIGLVVAYGIGIWLQLYRLRYPDIPVLGPEAGSHCHTMLRIFAGLPTSCDGAMTAPLFAAGIELRQKSHQKWFLSELATRIGETGLHALKFLREGVRFAYLKLDGMHEGRFIKIKEGAASRIDGISENLWSAEGMLCSMEALSLYEPDTSPAGTTFTFQGDFDLAEVDLENEVPYESASSRASTLSPDRAFPSPVEEGRQRKKSKSVSPGAPLSGFESLWRRSSSWEDEVVGLNGNVLC